MHHQFVVDAEGEKLSKSLGNFTNLLDLIETMDPRSYRMLLLQSHYRSPGAGEHRDRRCGRAGARRARHVRARAAAAGATGGVTDTELVAAFTDRMDDDLDIGGSDGDRVRRRSPRAMPRSTPVTLALGRDAGRHGRPN